MISPFDNLYGTRLLIFLEDKPQSNKYHQVLLTLDEFKKASMMIGTVVEEKGHKQIVELQMSEELYDLPDLEEHYSVPHDPI